MIDKITLEPDSMEWIDELLFDRVNEIGSGWIYKEEPVCPEEFFWWVDILEYFGTDRKRKKKAVEKWYIPKIVIVS